MLRCFKKHKNTQKNNLYFPLIYIKKSVSLRRKKYIKNFFGKYGKFNYTGGFFDGNGNHLGFNTFCGNGC